MFSAENPTSYNYNSGIQRNNGSEYAHQFVPPMTEELRVCSNTTGHCARKLVGLSCFAD